MVTKTGGDGVVGDNFVHSISEDQIKAGVRLVVHIIVTSWLVIDDSDSPT